MPHFFRLVYKAIRVEWGIFMQCSQRPARLINLGDGATSFRFAEFADEAIDERRELLAGAKKDECAGSLIPVQLEAG